MIRPLLAALLLSSLPAAAQTQTVLLSAIRDTTLYQDASGALGNGSGQFLFVGVAGNGQPRRAVLEFDIGAIPQRSRIVDVELRLVVSRSTAQATTQATLHRVTADWGEGASIAPGGEGGGGPAAPGDATWLHTFFPNQFWAQPGGDYDPTPSSETTLPLLGAFAFTKTEELIADVQHWLNGSRPNHGWLVRTAEAPTDSARRIDSRNNTQPGGIVPELRITYLPPGAIEGFGNGCTTSGNVPFTQTITGPAVQGGAVTLSLSSGVPLGLVVSMLSYDVRTQPLPSNGCEVWLRAMPFPTLLLRQQDAAGNSTDVFPIPFEPTISGTPLAVQTILVDFASPRQYALSNAHLVCIQ